MAASMIDILMQYCGIIDDTHDTILAVQMPSTHVTVSPAIYVAFDGRNQIAGANQDSVPGQSFI